MVHRLAMQFNEPDVQAFLKRVPAPQLWHWLGMNQIDPWTRDRDDFHAALVASTVANGTPGRRRNFKVSDFMPDWLGSSRITDPSAMKNLLNSLFGLKK